MPIGEKFIHKQTFEGGINTDLARELMRNNQARFILNCNISSSDGGNLGIITNVKGTIIIETPLPSGNNKTIGYATDEENGRFAFFVYNDQKFHSILEYDDIANIVRPILINIVDTGGKDILRFNLDYLILPPHASYYKGSYYWVDGLNNPRKANRSRCIDKTSTGYGTEILEEFISAYKPTSIYPPTAKYISDTTKLFNRVYGMITKYAQRYIYRDDEISVLGDFSAVVIPDKEPSMGINSIPTNNNGIEITVETGSMDVEFIEIFMQNSIADINEVEGILNWKKIAVIDKRKLGIPDNSQYIYTFFNDENYPVISATDVMQPQSFMMMRPRCQAISKDVITYANGYVGNPKIDVQAELEILYSDLFIDDGQEEKFNFPNFITGPFVGDYVNDEVVVKYDRTNEVIRNSPERNAPARFLRQTLTIGHDVKRGNKFTYTATNGDETVNIYYEATLIDSAITVAAAIKERLIATGKIYYSTPELPPTDIHNNDIDGDGNVTFSFIIKSAKNRDYLHGSTYVNPVLYSTLKDTGVSVKNEKMNSRFRLYYEYILDNDGRKSGAFTDDALIVNIKSENELGGIKAVKIRLKTFHKPIEGATYWQILRTEDLSRKQFTQFLVQKIVTVPTENTSEYIDLIIGSYLTYFKLHPNSTINYEFAKGDRVVFIRKIDDTYYPYYETEVLEYNDIVTDRVRQNVKINGSNIVTVSSADASNVGKFIIIDNAEREIIAASGTTYTLSNIIGTSTEQTFLYFDIIDRRGILRIRKPSESIIQLEDNSIIEVSKPSLSLNTDKTCFEIQQKFPIINSGTPEAYHGGNIQNQTASQPSIVEFNSGIIYVRNREFPLNNIFPGTQVVVGLIEDDSYSDFYVSMLNDLGRPNSLDTGKGIVKVGSRVQYSGKNLETTTINGFNNFKNLDRADYEDDYGDIMLTVFDFGKLIIYKHLRTGFVSLDSVITQDLSGKSLLVNGSNFLNPIQYYAWEGGIGNNPESYASNGTHRYYVSTNSGVIIRFGGNGEEPISRTFFLDDATKKLLNEAAKNKAKIFGGFDRRNDNYILFVEGFEKYVYFDGFSSWLLDFPPLSEDTIFEIVTPPINGSFDLVTQTYTPPNDFIGDDPFFYRAFIGGEWSQPKKVCIKVVENPNRETAWRPIGGSCQFNSEGERTGLMEYSTLEQFYISDQSATGITKPNNPTDPDYVNPIEDLENCFPIEWVIAPDYSYCEQASEELGFLWAKMTSYPPAEDPQTGVPDRGHSGEVCTTSTAEGNYVVRLYKSSSQTELADEELYADTIDGLAVKYVISDYYEGYSEETIADFDFVNSDIDTQFASTEPYLCSSPDPIITRFNIISLKYDGRYADFSAEFEIYLRPITDDADNTGFLIQPKLKKQAKTTDYTTMGDFPAVGTANVFYKDLSTGIVYRFIGGSYVSVNPDIDVNNNLCEETGLPVAIENNPVDSETYRVLNTGTCPIDPGNEVFLTMSGNYLGVPDNKFTITAALSAILTNDLSVDFSFTFKDDGILKNGGTHGVVITAGQLEGTIEIPNDVTLGTVTDIEITVVSTTPNPNGGKTIIY